MHCSLPLADKEGKKQIKWSPAELLVYQAFEWLCAAAHCIAGGRGKSVWAGCVGEPQSHFETAVTVPPTPSPLFQTLAPYNGA